MTHCFLLPNWRLDPPLPSVFLAWFLYKEMLRIKRYHPTFLSTQPHATTVTTCNLSSPVTVPFRHLDSSILVPGQQAQFQNSFIPRLPLLQFFYLIESPNPMPLLLLIIHQPVTSSFYFCRHPNWFHGLLPYPSLADTLNSPASLFCHCFCWTKPQPWVKTAIHLHCSRMVAAKLYWRKSQSLTYWFYIKWWL